MTGEELQAYLRRRFPDSPDLRVTQLDVVPGGRSKETLLVSLSGTTELPKEVIVRKDRPIGLLATKASDEFAILRAVHDHGGVPVARPLFADDSDDAGTLLVMERVRGEKAGEYFPDLAMPAEEYRHAIGTQLATALAHLHAVPLDTLAGTGLDLDAQVNEASLSAAVNGMAGRIGELSGPPIAAVPLARQWLLDHVDDVVPSGPLSLLQGDFGLHNTLVDGERVTALVDWEAATIGPAARELAAAWPAATALMEWPAFVAHVPRRRRLVRGDRRVGRDLLPRLLRAGRLHVEPDRRPPLPHRRQAGPPDRALGARRPLPGPAQPRSGPGRRGGPDRRTLTNAVRRQKLRTCTVSSRCSRGRVTMKTCTSPMSSTLCPL